MSYEQAKALLDKSVSRPTLYSVRVPRVDRTTNDYINFFCSATSIPEVRVDTIIAAGHENMGIVREQPTAVMFGKPFTMTIIENSEFSVYKDLRSWLDQTAQGAAQQNGQRSQRMQYYDTFTSDMEMLKLELPDDARGITGSAEPNANLKEVLKITFIKAYPINIGAVALASDAIDTYTTFDVSFTYESYTLDDNGGVIGQLQ